MNQIRYQCIVLLEVMKDTLNKCVITKNPTQMADLLYNIYLSPECFEFVLSQFYTNVFRPAYKDILRELNLNSIYQIHKFDDKDILYEVAINIINQKIRENKHGDIYKGVNGR